MFSQSDFANIATDLTAFEEFLRSMGLHKSSDRLQTVARNVNSIVRANVAGTADELMRRPDVEELVWALVDAVEFCEIFAGLKHEDPVVLKPLLRKALQGTVHPGRETAHRSNIGRNTAFELRLAAGLIRSGAKVTLGQRADLILDHAGARVYIECKRPFGLQSIRPNVVEARRQLRDRLNGSDHQVNAGVVAVSVSRALNSGSRLFAVKTPSGLGSLARDIAQVHAENSADYDRLPDLRLVGVLYHLHTPALVTSRSILVAATETVGYFSGPAMQTAFPVSLGQPLKALLNAALGPVA